MQGRPITITTNALLGFLIIVSVHIFNGPSMRVGVLLRSWATLLSGTAAAEETCICEHQNSSNHDTPVDLGGVGVLEGIRCYICIYTHCIHMLIVTYMYICSCYYCSYS